MKCEVYWPREVGCSTVHGSIEFTLTDFTQLADYTIGQGGSRGPPVPLHIVA